MSSTTPGAWLIATVHRFAASAVGPPALLLAAAVAGFAWINIDAANYERIWSTVLSAGPSGFAVEHDLHGWVNDALMVLFFFAVGIEVKREMVVGQLRDPKVATLPVVAAAGGMIIPAILYVAVNGVGSGDASGWAIPVATDIAFTLGVLALLGRRVPVELRLFVLALAIADDVGGILIIAIFFADDISIPYLGLAVAIVALTVAMRISGLSSPAAFLPVGLMLWLALTEAGIEPTIAGVLLGLLTPALPVRGRDVIADLERVISPWVALIILPLFGLANAGVAIEASEVASAVTSPVALGVSMGLVVGKCLGITAATFWALRSGIGSLPETVDRRLIAPTSLLGGIGFTVALFVADLTFQDPEILGQAKLGVLTGSLTAGLLGTAWFLHASRAVASDDKG